MGRPDGSWYWVVEPNDSMPGAVRAGDGRVLTRRAHGAIASAIVRDQSDARLHVATSLRVAAALPASTSTWDVRLIGDDVPGTRDGTRITLSAPWLAVQPTRHTVDAELRRITSRSLSILGASPREPALDELACPEGPARRVLFFESLMNSDMPHNDAELSQGVLHMASALRGTGTEIVLANVKMSITDPDAPHVGLDTLERALAGDPIELVCITLLEGYWDGVVELIRTLRRLGCRAHVAVGGVMATLAPEATAAHLPDVSFVCRGAGEYFVPRLARILGRGASIDRSWTDPQLSALASMRGLIAIDRTTRTLVSARSSETVAVDDLDAVDLDLDLIERRHLERGLEISTARGCIHKCTFCSILGRQSYQARTANGVLALLSRYEDRFQVLFDGNPPSNVHRVHVSDDDFACDKVRAATFLGALRGTPFRLSSVQVSVADLCLRRDGVLLPEPDPVLLDVITPECFADGGAAIPVEDFVADHRSRRWSAYLQIGVETFADTELRRLGKGYRVEHVRSIVRALARKRVHVDAYFIASNAETEIDDLVSSVEEACRLKIRYAEHFHVRFPIVPRLVSYATSASHRRMLLRGEADRMQVRAHARVPSHPELDYVFVEHDVSRDELVDQAIRVGFFTDQKRYTGSLDALAAIVRAYARASNDETLRTRCDHVLRRLDDAPRRLAFAALAEAREDGRESVVLPSVEAILGPTARWLRAFRRSLEPSRPRVFVRTSDPDDSERVGRSEVLRRSIALAGSTARTDSEITLAVESSRAWSEVRAAIEGVSDAVMFVVRGADDVLDADASAWLSQRGVRHELRVDDRASSPTRLACDAVVIAEPSALPTLSSLAARALARGAPSVRIEIADADWAPRDLVSLGEELGVIGLHLRRARGSLANLLDRSSLPASDVTVTADGRIYAGRWSAASPTARTPIGHLDDAANLDRYVLDGPPPSAATRDARRVLDRFVTWMREPDEGASRVG